MCSLNANALVGSLLGRVGEMKESRQGIGKTLQGFYCFVATRSKRFPVMRGHLCGTQGCTLSIWDLHSPYSSEYILQGRTQGRRIGAAILQPSSPILSTLDGRSGSCAPHDECNFGRRTETTVPSDQLDGGSGCVLDDERGVEQRTGDIGLDSCSFCSWMENQDPGQRIQRLMKYFEHGPLHLALLHLEQACRKRERW